MNSFISRDKNRVLNRGGPDSIQGKSIRSLWSIKADWYSVCSKTSLSSYIIHLSLKLQLR